MCRKTIFFPKGFYKIRGKMVKENEERKLTKEQKADKIKRKFDRDSKKEVRACLFKIQNLTAKKIRFKIDRNSKQLYLTGVCLMMRKNNPQNLPSLIYVEGGPLAIKKLKNLLLKRIDWNFISENKKGKAGLKKEGSLTLTENENGENKMQVDADENNFDEDIEEEDLVPSNQEYKIKQECLLVWEGILKKRLFEQWKMSEVKCENDFKKILSDKGMEHYWNLVNSFKIEDI